MPIIDSATIQFIIDDTREDRRLMMLDYDRAEDWTARYRSAKADADRRLGLLRRMQDKFLWCPICDKYISPNNLIKADHADDCALAKELR